MGKEPVVQPSEFPPKRAPGHHTRSGRPQHVIGGVILPAVLFDSGKNSPAAEGEAVAVEQASCSAGVFEAVLADKFCIVASRVAVLAYEGVEFRSADPTFGMTVHPVHQWFEPAFADLYVGVDQQEILSVNLFERPVVPSGKSVVAVEDYAFHLREAALEKCDRTVAACIVRHHNLGNILSVTASQCLAARNESGQPPPQVSFGVPVEYDQRYLHFYRVELGVAAAAFALAASAAFAFFTSTTLTFTAATAAVSAALTFAAVPATMAAA